MRAVRPLAVAFAFVCAHAGCQWFLDTEARSSDVGADAGDAAPLDALPVADADRDGASDAGIAAGAETLREGLSSPDSLIVDGNSLYWLETGNPGRVVAVTLDHWSEERVLATDQHHPFRAIVYAGSLFWTTLDEGWLHRLEADGGDVVFGGALVIGGLASAGGGIYYAYGSGGQGSMTRCTPTDCPGGSVLYAAEATMLDQLRSTAVGLAWIIQGSVVRACSSGDCSAIGGVHTVGGDANGVTTFASDTDFFYIARGGGGIVSVPLAAREGDGAQAVLSDPRVVTSLVSDGTMLYFSDRDGRISTMPRLGGAVPVDLARTTKGPARSLVASGAYVYWAEGDAIRRVRMTP